MKFLDKFKKDKPTVAVMFADIAGSTKLYDKIGDVAAQKKINSCISMMTSFVQKNQGEVVKTIGDEIMCRFPNGDNAALTAKDIQIYIEKKSANKKTPLQVRIGIHYGEVIVKKNDLFGDVINVAARVAAIAKAKQILITEQLQSELSMNIGLDTRKFDSVKVKGKTEELVIYEVIWEEGSTELTVLASAISDNAKSEQLILEYDKEEKELDPNIVSFVMGRGTKCDFAINSNLASRTHAVIEYQRGKFVLKDQSSNGTYVQDQDGKDLYLRREAIPLIGQGSISLGEPIATNRRHIIRYHCY